MRPLFSTLRTLLVFIFIPTLVSFACLSLTSDPPTGIPATEAPLSEELIVEGDMVYGPGDFIFPDTRAGLSDLTSYKATLNVSFDGSRAGSAEQWSRIYIMLTSKEPAARQLTIEKSGNLPDPGSIFMAEMGGVTYERLGENPCTANLTEQGNALGERMEPAGFLTGVHGAETAGNDTVNGAAANHYTFDERAFGQLEVVQSTGEVWVASEGGYIVKYVVTTTGNEDYFGNGIEGSLTLDYELTDINAPVTFNLPEDCPAGLVDAPLLPDASNVINLPGVLTYETSTGLAEAAAFYQEQIPGLGWISLDEPGITETTAFLEYRQGDQNLTVILSTEAGVTTVYILLERSKE